MMDFGIGANGVSDQLVINGDNSGATLDFSFEGTGAFLFRLSDASGAGLSAAQVIGQSYKLVRLSSNSSTNYAWFAPQIKTVSGNGVRNIDGTYAVINDGTGNYLTFNATSFQPVPAPPAAVSLAIGAIVGLFGTLARRLRGRREV